MKLVSFTINDSQRVGVLVSEGVFDYSAYSQGRITDMKTLLSTDGEMEKLPHCPKVVDYTLDQISLLPVVVNPGTIWCAGMNTHTHYKEAADRMHLKELPKKPVLFLRSAQTLVASNDYLEKPALEPMFDYEGEIALVIGKEARNVTVEDALSYVAGYSCFNDASARQYQINSNQITAGKNAFRSGGFGPCLATPDEVSLDTMKMECRVNGNIVQSLTLDDLIFSFAELISYISEFTWLMPGDVIVTGSPEGIGALREPQILLNEGDSVEVEVTGIGVLVNPIKEQTLPCAAP